MDCGTEITDPFSLSHHSARSGFRCSSREWEIVTCTGPNVIVTSFEKVTQVTVGSAEGATAISEKTLKEEICDHRSVLSNTNVKNPSNYSHSSQPIPLPSSQTHNESKDQPVIRVTVIPNNRSDTNKKLRAHRRILNKVKISVSNQDKSIKSRSSNVYLRLTGGKRENIHEIKTSSSAKLSRNQSSKVNDETVEENLKDLMKSLNMEKKRKRVNNQAKTEKKTDEYDEKLSKSSFNIDFLQNPKRNNAIFMPDCYCPQSGRRIPSSDMRDLRSRVKIVGRIGLDQDDKYILDCAATVDDEPIETNIKGNLDGHKFERIARTEHESRKRGQRDFIMQADIGNSCGPIDVRFSSVGTQCSPANFNYVCFSNVDKIEIASNPNQTLQLTNPPKNVHCNCNSTDFSAYESKSQASHNCSNPLVIISVYSKQDATEKVSNRDNDADETRSNRNVKCKSPSRKTTAGNINNAKRVLGGKQNSENDGKNKTRSPGSPGTPRSPRSRSPSPGRSPVKVSHKPRNEVKQTEVKGQKSRNCKGLPGTKIFDQNTKQLPKNTTAREPSPRSLKLFPNTSRPSTSKSQSKQNDSSIRKTEMSESGKNRSSTDPVLTKKAIVDAYTNKVTGRMNCRQPKAGIGVVNDSSNVAVSIDGESEYYDVIFRQGNRTTDLKFRKTLKNQGSRKDHADANPDGTDSLENFFYMTDEDDPPHRRPMNLTDDGDFRQTPSRLKDIVVRDSIELCHRRETSNMLLDFNSSRMSISNHSSNISGLAHFEPSKHFKGDDCPLSDPFERDKEIRQLLGIENRKPSTSRYAGVEAAELKNKSRSVRGILESGETKVVSEIQDNVSKSYKVAHFDEPSHAEKVLAEVKVAREHRPGTIKAYNSEKHKKYMHIGSGDEGSPPVTYRQLILSRKIQFYVQMSSNKNNSKEKLIPLTRAQYGKVKRSIENVLPKKQGLKCSKKPSGVSVRDVKRKSARKILRKSQLDNTHLPILVEEISHTNNMEHETNDSSMKYKNKRRNSNTQSSERKFRKQSAKRNSHRERTKEHRSKLIKEHNKCCSVTSCPSCHKLDLSMCVHTNSKSCNCVPQDTYWNCSGLIMRLPKSDKHISKALDHANTTETHYTNVSYKKQLRTSSTNENDKNQILEKDQVSDITVKKNDSFHTIFKKGHKKSRTPNLGTSAVSLFSEYPDVQYLKGTREEKPRKPFFRRLMSYLVLAIHSMPSSHMKGSHKPMKQYVQPTENSIDSYDISSSFAGADLGSSMYDTSPSFYSTHSVGPVVSKQFNKRSFLSSVKGFLYH